MARLYRAPVRLKTQQRFLPQSHLGKAIGYALHQWPSLHVMREDGRVEIDNNLVGHALRPTAIGKKNRLFIGAAAAGQRSAIISSVIECPFGRLRASGPFAYLREVFPRPPTMTNWQVQDLTPAAWAQAPQRADGRAAASASYPAGIRRV